MKPFALHFDLETGKCGTRTSSKRYLSQMKGMYHDEGSLQKQLEVEDTLVYEFYELDMPEHAGDLAFGTSIIYPGKVGDEYYMTKGHFHAILNTAEVYFCLQGQGLLLMENTDGEWCVEEMAPGNAVYVSKGYAHRTINIGHEPLVFFWAFRADAGHDYGTIETNGFRKLVVEQAGAPVLIDNPNWK